MMKEEVAEADIYAVKTTVNQERAVARSIEAYVKKKKGDVRAILAPDELKGYILIETTDPDLIDQAIQTIPYARVRVAGSSDISEVEHFLTPKPTVTGIEEGCIVELISGPFKGERAIVKRVDETHEEITIELFEAMVPIPVTVRGDSVRILSRDESNE
ncbi:MAG: transcription elongation factor Spt5 [Candidatus Syntropharchaeales archaeon]